jgi:hypothetical protein
VILVQAVDVGIDAQLWRLADRLPVAAPTAAAAKVGCFAISEVGCFAISEVGCFAIPEVGCFAIPKVGCFAFPKVCCFALIRRSTAAWLFIAPSSSPF